MLSFGGWHHIISVVHDYKQPAQVRNAAVHVAPLSTVTVQPRRRFCIPSHPLKRDSRCGQIKRRLHCRNRLGSGQAWFVLGHSLLFRWLDPATRLIFRLVTGVTFCANPIAHQCQDRAGERAFVSSAVWHECCESCRGVYCRASQVHVGGRERYRHPISANSLAKQ